MPAKKFVVPFASTGNKTPVPDTLQPDGTVSYAQGFGPDYELDKTVDPVNAKDVPRAQTNQLYYDLTDAVGEQQLYGVALWGADRAPYPLNARAYHTGKLWRSSVANNNGEPGVSGWDDVSNVVAEADQVQAEAGTAQGVYSSPLRVFQALRSAAANATELLRGTLRIGTQAEVDAGTLDDVAVTPKKLRHGMSVSLNPNGYIVMPTWLGGLIIQWGTSSQAAPNSTVTAALPIAFPNASLRAWAFYDQGTAAVAPSFSVERNLSQISITNHSPGGLSPSYIAIGY